MDTPLAASPRMQRTDALSSHASAGDAGRARRRLLGGPTTLASRGHSALRAYNTDRGVLICAAEDRLRMLVSRHGRRVTLDYDEADDFARSLAEALRGNLGFSVAALLRGELPLHCAAVEIEGRQVAIVAATGAGKTTLLWHMLDHGTRLVCDDVLLVRGSGAGGRVSGASPPVPTTPTPPELGAGGPPLCGVPAAEIAKLPEQAIRERGLDWSAARRVLPDEDDWWFPVPAELQATEALPISALFVLQPFTEPEPPCTGRWAPLRGGEALRVLADNTQGLWAVQGIVDARRLLGQYRRLLRQAPLFALRYDRRPEMVPVLANVIRRLAGVEPGGPPPPGPAPVVPPPALPGPVRRSRPEPTEMDILRWAAGSSHEMPYIPDVRDDRILRVLGLDEERLLYLIELHRLAPRFTERYKGERPGWCSRELLAGVLAQAAAAHRRRYAHLEAMRQISAACGDPGNRPIAIKGYSTFALTGDPRHVHLSGDLDVFTRDPDALWRTLRGLGYSLAPGAGRQEYYKAARGGIVLEAHGYYPVVRYPDGLLEVDVTPAHHPACWRQDFPGLGEEQLTWRDLQRNAACGLAPGTEGLVVPGPAASILAMCAHDFHTFVRFIYQRGLTAAYLSTLANIYDLARHPLFDPAQFRALVRRLHAADAVAYAGWLLERVYGDNPLAPFAPVPDSTREGGFPVLLNPDGWAAFLMPDDLLIPSNMGDVIRERIGVKVVVAASSGEPRAYSFGEPPDRDRCDRRIVRAGGDALPFRLALRWDEAAITFGVTFPSPPGRGESYRVHVCFYDDGYERYIASVHDGGARVWESDEARARLTTAGDACTLHMDFPWEVLRHEVLRKDALVATLSVSRRRDDDAAAEPSVLVPLCIRRV